jgi:hypothetical protein
VDQRVEDDEVEESGIRGEEGGETNSDRTWLQAE